jgi:hypothetical protein
MICSICNLDKLSGVFNNNIIYCENCIIILNNKLIQLNTLEYNNLIYFKNQANNQTIYNNIPVNPIQQPIVNPIIQQPIGQQYTVKTYKN